jgi:DNA-binding transcriptional LysR family regulator
MELRHLRYFVAAVEQGSLRAAAERMNVAQPALSRRIRDLEMTLSCNLLERQAHGVTPTEAGKAFYEEIRTTLCAIERAVDHAKSAGVAQHNVVRLGLMRNSRRYAFAPEAIAEYRRSAPESSIAFTREASPALEIGLEDGRVDLALIYEAVLGEAPLGPPKPQERLIHIERYMLAIHPGHALSKAEPAALRDLANTPVVLIARDENTLFYDALLERFHREGFEPIIAHTAGSNDEMIDLTISSGGVCFAAASTMLSTPSGALTFRPLLHFDLELRLKLAWKANLSAHARRLLDHMNAAIDRHQSEIRAQAGHWHRLFGQTLVWLPEQPTPHR